MSFLNTTRPAEFNLAVTTRADQYPSAPSPTKPPTLTSQSITIHILSPGPESDKDQVHVYQIPISVLSRTSSFFGPFLYGYVGTLRISWIDHESWELYQHWLFTGTIVTPVELYGERNIGDLDQQARASYLGLIGSYCFGKRMSDMRFTDGVMNRLIALVRSPAGRLHHLVSMLIPSTQHRTSLTGTVDGVRGIPPKLHPIITMAYSLPSMSNALHRFLTKAIAWFASPGQIAELATSTVEAWLKTSIMIALGSIRGVGYTGLTPGLFALDKCMFHDHAGLHGKECVAP